MDGYSVFLGSGMEAFRLGDDLGVYMGDQVSGGGFFCIFFFTPLSPPRHYGLGEGRAVSGRDLGSRKIALHFCIAFAQHKTRQHIAPGASIDEKQSRIQRDRQKQMKQTRIQTKADKSKQTDS